MPQTLADLADLATDATREPPATPDAANALLIATCRALAACADADRLPYGLRLHETLATILRACTTPGSQEVACQETPR
jgi:hypothetical protein